MRALFSRDTLARSLFWSWNILFVGFMLLGFAPLLLPQLIDAVRAETVPAEWLLYAALLTAIPLAAVALGIWLRRDAGRLLILGYGVEGPLMLLLGLRFFVVRDATPGVLLLLGVAAIGLLTLLWDLLDSGLARRGYLPRAARAAGLTALVAVGLYACLWFAFYALPLAGVLGRGAWYFLTHPAELFSNTWRMLSADLRWLPFQLLFLTIGLYSATLLIGLPIAVPIIYLRRLARALRQLARGDDAPAGEQRSGAAGPALAISIPIMVLALIGVGLAGSLRQPQHAAFALLDRIPASAAEREALLGQAETIRAGLLNAYLAPQRYVSVLGGVAHVPSLYRESLGMAPEQAQQVQRLYERVAWPVLYEPAAPAVEARPSLQADQPRAAELYQRFFDQPMTDAERPTIVRAVRSTWSFDQAALAWQLVDDREVQLLRQELTLAEHGDWAEVELYEVYQNQTDQRQEVIYYFSLPESAVLTGVWLGTSPDRAQRFAYQVAPRGAAQAVYQREVRRNVDPALLEQIGPRQYRLRVFPIEPRAWRWEETSARSIITEAPALHLWMRWQVLADDGAWPMPQLAELRNVYWDGRTVRLLNGAPMDIAAQGWLPERLPAAQPAAPREHRVAFPGGWEVTARPASPAELPAPAGDLRLAVVVDRSLSMAAHSAQLDEALAQLRQLAAAGSQIDVYLSAAGIRGEAPVRTSIAALGPDELRFFGGQNPSELLIQFSALREGRQYAGVLVLTDQSAYELGPAAQPLPALGSPLWMIHLGDGLPLGYDDATLEAIQASGGGVAGSLSDALGRLALARAAPAPGAADVIDGYVWSVVQGSDPGKATPEEAGFAAFAARRLVIAGLARGLPEQERLARLDTFHALAVAESIVTPYSSMIVLVNAQQEQLLEELSGQADRFEREFEAVGETAPNTPPVTGVPEPEEWLLIGVGAALLAAYAWQRRRSRPILREA